MKANQIKSLLLLAPMILCISAGSASAAVISLVYAGYGYNTVPAAAQVGQPGYSTGNVVVSGTSFSDGGTYTTTGGFLGNTGTISGTIADGASLSISTVLSANTTFNDPGYIDNRQGDNGYYMYVGFTVDTTGSYIFGGTLNAFTNTVTPAPSGGYSYYGIGGNANIATVGGAGSGTGNFGDPVAPSTPYTLNTPVTLLAGTTYQIDLSSYMYIGGGGMATNNSSSGWNLSLTAVPIPEVSSALLSALGVIGFGLRRRR